MSDSKKPSRTYKDGIFRKLFNEKEKMLELYNALKGTNYGPEVLDEIEILTLDNTVYMGIRNDLAFSMKKTVLVLGEHQSTFCANLSIRMGEYLGEILQGMFGDTLYGTARRTVPIPEFYVFYNGEKNMPAVSIQRLSDHYPEIPPENSAEIVVKLINICYAEGKEILENCRTLREYSLFIHFVREFERSGRSLNEAVEAAIKKSMSEGVLEEFLQKNASEVTGMIHTEVTMERYGEILKDEGIEIGISIGEERGISIGEERGMEKKAVEAAKALKEDGVDDEIISRAVGLPLEMVREIL